MSLNVKGTYHRNPTTSKPVPDMTYNVCGGTLNLAQPISLYNTYSYSSHTDFRSAVFHFEMKWNESAVI